MASEEVTFDGWPGDAHVAADDPLGNESWAHGLHNATTSMAGGRITRVRCKSCGTDVTQPVERQFPLLRHYEAGDYHGMASVPWAMVAPHEKQAKENHSQSLAQLADRGGLAPGELLCVLDSKSLRDYVTRPWKEQDAEVKRRVDQFRRVA